MRKFLSFALALAALSGTARADAVDDVAARILKNAPVAGFSVGVMRHGKLVAERGYGGAGPGTVFHIDSVTKNITAATVLRLAERGKLGLDDPLAKYVPGTGGRDIRLRNLLNHTSGLANFTELKEWDALESRPLTHKQVVDLVARQKPGFAPGTVWSYSNSGFYLLGMIAERVSGRSYGAIVDAMFKRLGMRHSSYGCKAQGHEIHHGKAVPAKDIAWDNAFAAGGLCSTAGDLLIWERALQHGDVVSKTSLKAMTSPTRLADGSLLDYGLGTRLGTLGGHAVFGHTGGGAGFSAVLEYFPDDDLAIAVLSDTGGTIPASSIAAAVARRLLNLPDKIADEPVTRPSDYVGIYRSGEGALEVFPKDGRLAFRPPGTKEALGMLRYQGNDVFAIDADTQVRVLRKDGKVTWAVGYGGGLMSDPKRRVRK